MGGLGAACTDGEPGTAQAEPVTFPPASPGCTRLVAEVPGLVADQGVRSSPASNEVASWGDPPIVLRCGVPRPAGFTATSQLFDVNGVSWFVEQGGDETTYTAVGRAEYVEVRVPAQYAGATVLVDLADAVTELPQRKPVPRRSAERSNRSTSAG